jgi:cobalt/nickel transport system permease protein
MHASLDDQFHSGNSFLHRADPRLKIIWAVGSILLVSLTPLERWPTIAGMLLLLWFSAAGAGVPLRWFLGRSVIAVPFVLAALPLPFTIHGTPIAQLPVVQWEVSREGLMQMTAVIMKSWVSVQAAILMASVTRFDRLLWGLRGLHLPKILVSVIGLMYRYLFVLADEVLRLGRARTARSGVLAGRHPPGMIWQAQTTGHLAGTLFVRSLERSERVYLAMASRGYQGEPRLLDPLHWQPSDSLLFLCAGLLWLLCLAAGFLR